MNFSQMLSQQFIMLTILIHLDFQTFFETTSLTLVSPGNIYNALTILFTNIIQVSPNASLEETTTAITTQDAIMFTGSLVAAYATQRFGFPAQMSIVQKKKIIIYQTLYNLLEYFIRPSLEHINVSKKIILLHTRSKHK